MAILRKFIAAATIGIDEQTGALLTRPAEEVIQAIEAPLGVGLTVTRPVIAQDAPGALALVAGMAGKIARIHALLVVLDGDGTVQLTDSDGTALTGAIPLKANQGFEIDRGLIPGNCLVVAAAGKGLKLVTTGGKAFGVATVSMEA